MDIGDATGEFAADYGLITRVANPFDARATVLILDGLHSYGLIGASKFLLRAGIERFIGRFRVLRGREFQVLVECRVEQPEVFIVGTTLQVMRRSVE